MTNPLTAAVMLVILGAGILTGLLFAFSNFALRALNVSLNDRLARASTTEAAVEWPDYRRRWQRWNHLRTAIGMVAALAPSPGIAAR